MMLTQRLSITLKSAFTKVFNGFGQHAHRQQGLFSWTVGHIHQWLPLFLGLVLGISLAALIVNETWHLAIAVAFLIPMVILFNRYPFVVIVVWLLLAPFLQVTPDGPMRVSYWIVHRAMIPAALILVILADQLKVNKSKSSITLGRADWAIVASIGILLVSVLVNYKSPLPLLYNLYDRFLVAFCAYWLIYFVAPREQDLKLLLPIALVIVVAEFVIGLLSWYVPDALPSFWIKENGRTNGTFLGYSGYTIGLALLSLLLFHAATNRKPGLVRTIFLIVFGLGIIGIFLSFSRGSWLAIVIVMLGLLLIYPKVTIRMAIVISITIAILGGSIMAAELAYAQKRFYNEQTALDRLVVYHTAWEMIKVKPFLGWGYETYDLYDAQFETRVANHVTNRNLTSHNTFLTILVERGVIGFLIYTFPVFWWLSLTFRAWSRMPNQGFWSRKLLIIFWLALVFQVVVGNFTDTKRDTFVFTTWWMILGFIANIVTMYPQPGDIDAPTWAYRAVKKPDFSR
jgi:O-antigen ligase